MRAGGQVALAGQALGFGHARGHAAIQRADPLIRGHDPPASLTRRANHRPQEHTVNDQNTRLPHGAPFVITNI